MRTVSVVGNSVIAASGVPLNVLCRVLADRSLDGFSGLYGIPGTVGGAVYMNAGAFGATVSDYITFVSVYCTDTGKIQTYSQKELAFSYRYSALQDRKNAVILSAEFAFPCGNQQDIREKMRQNLSKRMATQPTALPCAGSVFLRPKEGAAAQYIEKAGLKGETVGGAAVSLKHAGFIVNLGGASAQDVLSLIARVQNKVEKQFGIQLVPEIEYIGSTEFKD